MKTDNLIGLLARDLGTPPARPASVLWRWAPAAALLAGGLFLAILGPRPDIGTSAVLYPTALKLGLGALLACIASFGALRLTRPDADLSRPFAALAIIAVYLGIMLARDPSWMNQPMARWTSILRCVTLIPIMALLPLAAFLAALREGAVTRPTAAGALAGLAAAGLAILAYGLNCYEDSPLFIALWYMTAAAIAAVIGAVIARRVLVW